MIPTPNPDSTLRPRSGQAVSPVEPSATPRVGWIGTGVMGASMCGHVLAKGYSVVVHTRTKSKAQALVDRGAAWADTPG